MVHLAFLVDKKIKKYFFVIITCFTVLGCTNLSSNSHKEIPCETVMSNDMKICATYHDDKICITSEGSTKRIISVGEKIYSMTLVPRTKRWHGKLGLIEPEQPKNIFKSKDGTTRLLVTEAQITYNSVESSIERLQFYKNNGYNLVYNDDGLLVMWQESVLPEQNVLDVSLFQILINGEKPKKLPGSHNRNIIVQ